MRKKVKANASTGKRNFYGTISVPTPVFVKISSSTACGIRPSMKCTFFTPCGERGERALDFRDHPAGDDFFLEHFSIFRDSLMG